MFVEYFYYLKDRLPVSITEYMTLMQALNKGLIHNMVEFYYVSRSVLCKNEHHFDIYDISFANFFKDAMIQFPEDSKEEIWDWLQKDITIPELTQALEAMLKDFLNVEDFQKFMEDLLKKQSADIGEGLIINAPENIKEEIWDWLQKNLDVSEMDISFQQMISQLFDLEDLQKKFEDLSEYTFKVQRQLTALQTWTGLSSPVSRPWTEEEQWFSSLYLLEMQDLTPPSLTLSSSGDGVGSS